MAFKNTLGLDFKSQPSCSDTAVVAIDICDSTFFCLPNEIQKYAQCQGVSFYRGNETFCLESNWTLNGATVSVSTYFIHKNLINLNELCQGDEAENYIVLSPKTIPGYKNLSFSCEKCSFSGIFHQAYLADNTGVLESTQSFHQCLQCSRCGESWKPPSYLGLILHGQGQHEPKMTKITPANILMWKIQLFSFKFISFL